jgi:predicted dehydrogenase
LEKLRCSIVGLGRIGCLLEEDRLREKPCTHAGAITRNRDCTLAAGCDIDGRRRSLFARRWKCDRVFESLEEMLRLVPTDILHVATPPGTHRSIIERALPFGVKAIVCEKPLAETKADAERIARIHRAGRVKILTNHERRYSVDYLNARRHITRGTYGRLLSVSGRLYMGKGGDVFSTLLEDGTHLVDIIQFLAGCRLEAAGAVSEGTGRAKTLCILARSKVDRERTDGAVSRGDAGSIPVSLEVGTGRDHVVFELDLGFSSGRIRVGNGLYEEYESGPSPYYEGMKSLKRGEARRPRVTGFFSRMLEDAVACARESSHAPVSSALDGCSAVLFVDAVKRHFKGRRG